MAEDIEQVKARLRQDLLPRSESVAFASAILQFLNSTDRRTKREVLASDLAKHLSDHSIFLRQRKFVERLIHNRPAELDAIVKQSSWDEMAALRASLRETDWKPHRPRRIQSDEERTSRRRASKKRYEELRRKGGKLSLIEREFGAYSTPLLGIPTSKPWGPYLDGLLTGGGVSMSSGTSGPEAEVAEQIAVAALKALRLEQSVCVVHEGHRTTIKGKLSLKSVAVLSLDLSDHNLTH